MKRIFPYLFFLLFIGSCTIQKRHYRKGWTVSFHKEKSSDEARVSKLEPIDVSVEIDSLEEETTALELSNEKTLLSVQQNGVKITEEEINRTNIKVSPHPVFSCDIISDANRDNIYFKNKVNKQKSKDRQNRNPAWIFLLITLILIGLALTGLILSDFGFIFPIILALPILVSLTLTIVLQIKYKRLKKTGEKKKNYKTKAERDLEKKQNGPIEKKKWAELNSQEKTKKILYYIALSLTIVGLIISLFSFFGRIFLGVALIMLIIVAVIYD